MRTSSDSVSVLQLTVEKLLSPPETNSSGNHTDQQRKRTHSHLLHIISECNSVVTTFPVKMTSNVIAEVRWSDAEKRMLVKSLQLHHKDFSRIQKAVSFHVKLKPPSGFLGGGACSRVFVRSGPDQVRLGVRGVLLSVEEEDECQHERTEHQP